MKTLSRPANKKFIDRAPVTGFYAVIIKGVRHIIFHYSGEPMKGKR